MNRFTTATACVPLLACPYISFAQSSSDIETMVVTANRFEQIESSVLASVTVISRDEIEQSQASTALELLKTVPGITINSLGSKANDTAIYIRGTTSKHALVLVDGVRINSATLGGASIGLIPAFAIESIEVVRGPRAAVYGSDAIGGVIHITTVPKSGSAHELRVGYGSHGQDQQAWRSVGDISDSTSGSFFYSREQSDGVRIYDLAPEEDKHGYQSANLFGSLKHSLNENWSLFFTGYQQDSNTEYASQFTGTKQQLDNKFYSLASGVIYQNELLRSELQLSGIKDYQANGDALGTTAKSTITSRRHSISWLNTYVGWEQATVNLGLDYYQEQAGRGGSNTDEYKKTDRDNAAAFISSSFDLSPIRAELSLRHDSDSAFGGWTTWNVALGADVTNSIQVMASSGTAFKSPTFNDLYWPETSYSKGNPDLKPEKSNSSEIGIQGYHQALDWRLTGFQTDIDDLIDWAQATPADKWKPTNVESARIKGIEFALNFATGPIEHSLTAAWTDARDTKTDKHLKRIPKEMFSWGLNYQVGSLNTVFTLLYSGDRYDKNNNQLNEYTTADLGMGYHVTQALQLGLRVNNLLDREYYTGTGNSSAPYTHYYNHERNFLLSAQYSF